MNESDLEFDLLTSCLNKENTITNENWDIQIEENNIIGKLYFKPFDANKFICVDVQKFNETYYEFYAQFKSLNKIVDETEIHDFDDLNISDANKRMFVFLLYHPEYSEKLDKQLKNNLNEKLRRKK